MPKSRVAQSRDGVSPAPVSRPSGAQRTPVQVARDSADALFRAAVECCHQHERVSRVHAKSAVDEEIKAAQAACAHCNETLTSLSAAYQTSAAEIKPTGADEEWWHKANALWLASREYLRRTGGCDDASRVFKEHGPDRLTDLHTEYELEASALLALQHAAEAYAKVRPGAA